DADGRGTLEAIEWNREGPHDQDASAWTAVAVWMDESGAGCAGDLPDVRHAGGNAPAWLERYGDRAVSTRGAAGALQVPVCRAGAARAAGERALRALAADAVRGAAGAVLAVGQGKSDRRSPHAVHADVCNQHRGHLGRYPVERAGGA